MDVNELKALADAYETAYEARLSADKTAALLKEVEVDAKQALIIAMQEAKAENVVGTNKLFTLKQKEQPIIDNWEKLAEHILTTGDLSLIQRRISTTAAAEQMAAGETIPGVGTMVVFEISRGKKL